MHLTKKCFLCEATPTENYDLFVDGSEGLDICHGCEMIIIGFIRTLRTVNGKAKKRGYKLALGKNNSKKTHPRPDRLGQGHTTKSLEHQAVTGT